jgi:protein SCO1/2
MHHATAGEDEADVAPIGARFVLSTHEGKVVTDESFRGRHLIVFFGYTSCPDVCPTSLQTLAIALRQLGPLAVKVQPLFISLDPERDSVETIASYVGSFDPRITGLTGSREMIERMARGYRIIYRRVPGSRPGDYTIDHTASMFHMGPDGRYLGRFSQAMSPEQIADKLRQILTP